jgi:hypothetical protein
VRANALRAGSPYYGPRPLGALDAVTEALRAAGLTHSASEAALLADARRLP